MNYRILAVSLLSSFLLTSCRLLTDESEALDLRADAADLPQILTDLPPQFD